MAGLVAQLILGLGLIVALAVGLTVADRWVSGRPPRHRASRRRPRPAPGPSRRPIQLVAADLRRLSRQLALVPAGASLVRWRALWAAYDDVLIEAAEQLEVEHELREAPLGPARDIERIRVLAALEGAGLAVRA